MTYISGQLKPNRQFMHSNMNLSTNSDVDNSSQKHERVTRRLSSDDKKKLDAFQNSILLLQDKLNTLEKSSVCDNEKIEALKLKLSNLNLKIKQIETSDLSTDSISDSISDSSTDSSIDSISDVSDSIDQISQEVKQAYSQEKQIEIDQEIAKIPAEVRAVISECFHSTNFAENLLAISALLLSLELEMNTIQLQAQNSEFKEVKNKIVKFQDAISLMASLQGKMTDLKAKLSAKGYGAQSLLQFNFNNTTGHDSASTQAVTESQDGTYTGSESPAKHMLPAQQSLYDAYCFANGNAGALLAEAFESLPLGIGASASKAFGSISPTGQNSDIRSYNGVSEICVYDESENGGVPPTSLLYKDLDAAHIVDGKYYMSVHDISTKLSDVNDDFNLLTGGSNLAGVSLANTTDLDNSAKSLQTALDAANEESKKVGNEIDSTQNQLNQLLSLIKAIVSQINSFANNIA
jgi:phage shock protein A